MPSPAQNGRTRNEILKEVMKLFCSGAAYVAVPSPAQNGRAKNEALGEVTTMFCSGVEYVAVLTLLGTAGPEMKFSKR